jgi:hypothetical protein
VSNAIKDSGGHERNGRHSPLAVSVLMLGGAVLMTVVASVPSVADATEIGAGVTVEAGMTVEVADTPYPSDSGSSGAGKCEDGRNGWHIIMKGLSTSDGQPPTAGDFGPVDLAFSDGTTAQALFTDLSGRTAHFLNDTVNQQGSFTVTGGAMTLPDDTRITSFNKFAMRHTPCGAGTTSTTTSPVITDTTTTSPVSTDTTTAPPTTSTSPASSYPAVTLPTSVVPQEMPDGIGEAASAAVEREVQVARIAQANPGSDPRSPGPDGRPFIAVGLLLIIAGWALWIYTQRNTAA